MNIHHEYDYFCGWLCSFADASNWFVSSAVDKKAHSGSSSSLNKPLGDKGRTASVSTIESDRASLQGFELDSTGRGKFDQVWILGFLHLKYVYTDFVSYVKWVNYIYIIVCKSDTWWPLNSLKCI